MNLNSRLGNNELEIDVRCGSVFQHSRLHSHDPFSFFQSHTCQAIWPVFHARIQHPLRDLVVEHEAVKSLAQTRHLVCVKIYAANRPVLRNFSDFTGRLLNKFLATSLPIFEDKVKVAQVILFDRNHWVFVVRFVWEHEFIRLVIFQRVI